MESLGARRAGRVASLSVTPECRAELQELSDTTALDEHVASISWGVVAGGQLVEHGCTGTLHDHLRHGFLLRCHRHRDLMLRQIHSCCR